MNLDLQQLHPYPFEKLAQLFKNSEHTGGLNHIPLSIGEPKHTSPEFVKTALETNLDKLAIYPTTKGLPELRHAIADWANTRF